MRAQAEAIEDFAAILRELRESVGNPPFREMSGRSGAISHTTLHEATKGNRLPSWGTTSEFVKACGADPAAYRERWERANQAVRSAGAGEPATVVRASLTSAAERPAAHITIPSQEARADGGAVASAPAPPDEDVRHGSGRGRLTRPVAVALVTAAIGVGTVVVVVVAVDRDSGGKPSGAPSKAALSPADCPVHATNPAPAAPVHKGDAAAFIADITLPDCTRVGAGRTVTKVWRLKNTGKVPWQGYSLRRLDVPQQADQCQTISDVPIADTRPGEMVDIRAEITTPRKPGLCYVRFKMVDASGRVAYPGSRPVNFQVIVGEG
ncbi:NBR1-Ig-like domain-containing protein [Actinomadura sp. GTD37]|uniref:NBR1-Ig-like domain-containing protein n=1 Tax=Actinomadura sp. GTD37 TaxID=1778030 RepID=UPI0035C057E0